MQKQRLVVASHENHTKTPLIIGDGSLIGMTTNGHAYIEILQDNDRIVQYHIDQDGVIVDHADECRGDRLLTIPKDLRIPETPRPLSQLNWNNGRWRGMRSEEGVQGRVQPIPLAQKMALIQQLSMDISPMMLFGIDESYVHSGVMLSPQQYLLCRRLRLVYALPEIRYDEQLLPYDYDSIELYRLQSYDATAETVITSDMSELGSFEIAGDLIRPLDCMRDADHLYLFDGGDAQTPAHWYSWTLA